MQKAVKEAFSDAKGDTAADPNRVYMVVEEYVDWSSQTKHAELQCLSSSHGRDFLEMRNGRMQPRFAATTTPGLEFLCAGGPIGHRSAHWQDCRLVGASIRPRAIWTEAFPPAPRLAERGSASRGPCAPRHPRRPPVETNPNEPSSHGGDENVEFKGVTLARICSYEGWLRVLHYVYVSGLTMSCDAADKSNDVARGHDVSLLPDSPQAFRNDLARITKRGVGAKHEENK